MNKKVGIRLGLIIAMLIVFGVATVQASPARKITGGYFSLDFFGIDRGQFNVNVHEVDQATGEARGFSNWTESLESLGDRHVQAHPICVAFGEYEGQPAAVFVAKVDSITGWQDPAEFVGELFKFWVLDGGTPGAKGDAWSTLGPWPPTDNLDDYGCHYEDPPFMFAVNGGNLVIHE